jgi:hypothetical protein
MSVRITRRVPDRPIRRIANDFARLPGFRRSTLPWLPENRQPSRGRVPAIRRRTGNTRETRQNRVIFELALALR